MRSTGCAGFAGAMLAGASCFLWIGASYAKTNARLPAHNHDGIYAVHVMTRLGSCYKVYNTKIAVTGGQVHATGHALLRASGHIGPGGRVSVTLRLLHHAAHVAGSMRGQSGSENWVSGEFGLQRKVARRAAKLRYHRFRQMLLSDCWG